MTTIKGTIVSTTIPTTVSDLDGLGIMNWVVSVFLLMTAVSTPVCEKLADSIDRRPAFLFGITVFVVGSALCGIAQNVVELILLRVTQGLGPGAVQLMAAIITTDLYTFEKRAKVLGLNSGFWEVASVVALLLGGFIVQHLSWYWISYINMSLGIIAFLLVIFFLEEKKASNSSTLDLKRTTCLVISLLALVIFLQGLEDGLNLVLLGLVAVIIISAIIFLKTGERAKDPITPLDMLSNKEFTMINSVTLLTSDIVVDFEFYIPTWMQGINAISASVAGFAVTSSSLIWIVGSLLIGGMLGRWGIKKAYDYMLLVLIIVDLALILVPIYTPFWVFCLIATFNGITSGAITTASQARSQVLVGRDKIDAATGFNTLMRYLGQAMMVSIYGVTFSMVVAKHLAHCPDLTQKMMNDIVSVDKAKHLAANLISGLRQVLSSGSKSVYVASLIVIVLSLILNQLHRQKKITK